MRFLIIQTAFIGDVILATSVVEKLHETFPLAKIDFLLRKGNESLLENHPFIHELLIWDKKHNKRGNLFKVLSRVRNNKYDTIINLHRFASSGIITAFSGAKNKIGFSKNPFSFLYSKAYKHDIGNGKHETERNHLLIKDLTDNIVAKPRLYPSASDHLYISKIVNAKPFITIAPASVWFTKQFAKEKWIELIRLINTDIYLIGSPSDSLLCEEIRQDSNSNVTNLAGKLTFLQSAALIANAKMNYVNDSAPLHIASAVNAPVTAVFCSTVPSFGFGPLSDCSKVVETKVALDCKPCGLHGYKACPKGHFKCALTIDVNNMIA